MEAEQAASVTEQTPFTLDPQQEEAINLGLDITKRVVGVTGAAGSGKTTILRIMYEKLEEAGYNVVLCAPTGKAAKRIQEATGIDAMTIHRLLEYTHPGEPDPKTGKPVGFSFPKRTSSNRLEYDVVLVDEYAMVNDEVHRSLFAALAAGGAIRVFGDNNQLRPIETDDRLKEQPSNFVRILENFPSVKLRTVHRTGKDSGILLNLQQILKRRMPAKNDQWTMTVTDQPIRALTDYILESMDNGVDFTHPENQIITTQKNTWIGTIALNKMIQGLFHSAIDPSCEVPRHKWDKEETIRMYVGDKVIMTSNNYNLLVFNGETGVIKEIEPHTNEIIVDFGDREQAFPPVMEVINQYGKTVQVDPRRDLDLAYAITTHKSQGSEYRRVVYIMNKSTSYMQNIRNFYTACSRAREHVNLISDQYGIVNSLNKSG